MTKKLITLALCTTIYIILSMMIQAISFGPIQFRLGEMLMVLPFINKRYSISLILGCLIVNLFSTIGFVDVIFGTSSTVLMCWAITKTNNIWVIPIITGILTGVMIGLELHFILGFPLLASMLTVGAGEVIVVTLGVFIFEIIRKKNNYFYNLLKDSV
ncbi:QueT transporter family protein [Erysipelotrichaceae bacterium OttesenSCG-928-M19]|nr:QueT transporter family protein [Erysipelotrichaceae bacterium OttesenSCG-928-M19]